MGICAQVAHEGGNSKPGQHEAGAGGGRHAHPRHQPVRAGRRQNEPPQLHGALRFPPKLLSYDKLLVYDNMYSSTILGIILCLSLSHFSPAVLSALKVWV